MILGISGHPRGVGAALALLRESLGQARCAGAETMLVSVHEYAVAACEGWEWCTYGAGCVIRDEMWKIYPLLAGCRALIIATPVYFGGPTGVLKGWIDRCNPFWKDRHVLGRNLRPSRPGALIATAGSSHRGAFTGTLELTKAFFYSLGIRMETQLLIGGLDDIQEPPPTDEHCAEARALGRKIAQLERATDHAFEPDHSWWDHPPDQDRPPCRRA